MDIEAVTLKIEMQTVSAKVQLAEFGGSKFSLAAGGTLESVVQHEIKELGQHVLACTVTYRLPANARHVPGPAEDVSDPALQTFRKFYKFAVGFLTFSFPHTLISLPGNQSIVCEDQSPCTAITFNTFFCFRTGEDLPRSPYTEPYSRALMV